MITLNAMYFVVPMQHTVMYLTNIYTDVYLILDKLNCNGSLPKSSTKELQNPQIHCFISTPYRICKFKTRQRKKGHEKESNFLNIYILISLALQWKKDIKEKMRSGLL